MEEVKKNEELDLLEEKKYVRLETYFKPKRAIVKKYFNVAHKILNEDGGEDSACAYNKDLNEFTQALNEINQFAAEKQKAFENGERIASVVEKLKNQNFIIVCHEGKFWCNGAVKQVYPKKLEFLQNDSKFTIPYTASYSGGFLLSGHLDGKKVVIETVKSVDAEDTKDKDCDDEDEGESEYDVLPDRFFVPVDETALFCNWKALYSKVKKVAVNVDGVDSFFNFHMRGCSLYYIN